MSTRSSSSFRSMRAASSFTSSALTRRSTTRSVTCWAIASTGFRLPAGRSRSRGFTTVPVSGSDRRSRSSPAGEDSSPPGTAHSDQALERGSHGRHGVDSRRDLPDGLGPSLSRGSPGAQGHGRRVLDRRGPGHQPGVRPVRPQDRPCHRGRESARSGGISRRPAGTAGAVLLGVRRAAAPGQPGRSV